MPLGIQVGLSPGDFVLGGDPVPPQKGAETPDFWPMSNGGKRLMDQDAICTEVGLGPDDIVLDCDPVPSPTKGIAPIFGPRLLWPNGWMDEYATCAT